MHAVPRCWELFFCGRTNEFSIRISNPLILRISILILLLILISSLIQSRIWFGDEVFNSNAIIIFGVTCYSPWCRCVANYPGQRLPR